MNELKKAVKMKSMNEVLEFRQWLNEYIKFESRSQFKKGDKVWFSTPKYGRINGTVDRINSKTITVKDTVSENGKRFPGYRVHPTLLNLKEN